MKRIQYIEKHPNGFRINILGFECVLIKTDLYVGNNLFAKNKVVKGSTLGWNFGGSFISYNQLKSVITK